MNYLKTIGLYLALAGKWLIVHLLLTLLFVWHRLISPLFGSRCRFYPSCSEYASEALKVHGLLKGGLLSALRVSRCHPWCAGGLDFVPVRKNIEN